MADVQVLDGEAIVFGVSHRSVIKRNTADADAEIVIVDMPVGDSVAVPVVAFGIRLDNINLGMFNGVTQPMVATIDADKDSYVGLTYSADDTPVIQIRVGGSGTVRKHAIPDVASDTIALLDAAQTFTNKTLTAPTIADFTNANHDHGDADDGGALVSGIAITSPALTTPTITTSAVLTRTALAATTNIGFHAQNTTAALTGARVQVSPAIRQTGYGWETNVGSSMAVEYQQYVEPVTGAAAPTGIWHLQAAINGGAYSDVLTVTSAGVAAFAQWAQTLTIANSPQTMSITQAIVSSDTAGGTTGDGVASKERQRLIYATNGNPQYQYWSPIGPNGTAAWQTLWWINLNDTSRGYYFEGLQFAKNIWFNTALEWATDTAAIAYEFNHSGSPSEAPADSSFGISWLFFHNNTATGGGGEALVGAENNLSYSILTSSVTVTNTYVEATNLMRRMEFTGGADISNIYITNANMGFGVAMNAWGTGLGALQLGPNQSVWGDNVGAAAVGASVHMSQNSYYNGTDHKYISTAAASDSYQAAGAHVFRVAASGTAANTITWVNVLAVLQAGNVGVGTTTVGTGATFNVVLGGGATTPVIGAATADMVHLGAVDFAAGDRRLYIQSEVGSRIILGSNTLTLGLAGTSTGLLTMSGATSGVVTLTVAAIAGTWTFTLPAAVGAANSVLTDVAGDGITSWTTTPTFGTVDATTDFTVGTTVITATAVTFGAASDIVALAATAAALEVTNGTVKMLAFDTRVDTDNVAMLTITGIAPTFASAAGSTYNLVKTAALTLTLTGQVAAPTDLAGLALLVGAITVTDASAITPARASTVKIPKIVYAGSVTQATTDLIIDTDVAGCYLTSAGVWTSTSSRAEKHAIRELGIDVSWDEVLRDIQRAQAVDFIRDDASDGGGKRYGVIAEDVPDYLASPDRKGVADTYLAGAAFAGVQALMHENEVLKRRIAVLEKKSRV